MKCAYHPSIEAFGACTNCGRLICHDCEAIINGKVYCNQCSETLLNKKITKSKVFRKARTGTGCFIQLLGGILWLGGGLIVFIWTIHVLFSTFGIWTIFVGLLLAPVTYIASIFMSGSQREISLVLCYFPILLHWWD